MRRFRPARRDEAAIPITTHGELVYGTEKSTHRTAALEPVRELPVLVEVLASAADWCGKVCADLEFKGEIIASNHGLWTARTGSISFW
jgi:predicted nucleic acid-binding protein